MARGDVAAMRRLIGRRVTLQPPGGPPLKGRDAAIDWWSETLDTPGFSLTLGPIHRRFYPVGRIAYETAAYRMRRGGNGSGRIGRGRRLVVWEWGGSGWKVRSDLFYEEGWAPGAVTLRSSQAP